MTAGTYPENWTEVCKIGVIPEGGSLLEFAALTDDIDGFDFGDKDFEGRANVAGGRTRKQTPQPDEMVTLKMTPVTAAPDATGIVQHFHPQTAADSTDPISVLNTRTRKKFGLIFLWASTLPATAATAQAVGETAFRIQVINAQLVSYKPSFSDKDLTAEVKFKWTPFNKAGVANMKTESSAGDTGEVLPAGITSATTAFS